MEESLKQIESAEKLDSADLSELHALKAYYYYVLIAINSKVNGPKYYTNVFGECEKALEANSKNPRALAISFVFKKQMGSFLHADAGDNQKQLPMILCLDMLVLQRQLNMWKVKMASVSILVLMAVAILTLLCQRVAVDYL